MSEMPSPFELAVSTALLGMRNGLTPIRRPSWNSPPFFSRPLVKTATRRIALNTATWQTAVVVEGLPSYVGCIEQYAFASDVALKDSGVEFRFRANSQDDIGTVVILTDADYCRDPSLTSWPVIKQRFHKTVGYKSSFEIQVRNTSTENRYYFAGLFGYFYPSTDPETYTGAGGRRG